MLVLSGGLHPSLVKCLFARLCSLSLDLNFTRLQKTTRNHLPTNMNLRIISQLKDW